MSWETWFQDVGKTVINQASAAKFVQPYEIDKMRMQALGDLGLYQEGQPGAGAVVARGGLFGLSQQATVLLIGGALVAFLVMRD